MIIVGHAFRLSAPKNRDAYNTSATPTRLRSLSGFSIEWLEVNLGEYQVIDAEPPWAGEKEPQKDDKIGHLGKI